MSEITRAQGLSYPEALEKAQGGWLIAREGWNGTGMYVFLAVSGNFIAFDKSSGQLEPFLVMKTTKGVHVPWLCSQTDALAKDWAAVTRQTADRT